jgi:hypothetical protein
MTWSGASACTRWFRAQAVLALAQADRGRALQQLERGWRFTSSLMGGARTLVGAMVSTRLRGQLISTVVFVSQVDPLVAERAEVWLREPMDTRPLAQRWMPFEAQFASSALDEMVQALDNGHDNFGYQSAEPDAAPLWQRAGAWVSGQLSRRRIGFHPERSKQEMRLAWQQRMALLTEPWSTPLQAAVEEANTRVSPREAANGWSLLRWHNTLGGLIVDVAGGASDTPAGAVRCGPYCDYFARHADLELRHTAAKLALALHGAHVPAAERAAWAQAWSGAGADFKTRLRWSEQGRQMEVQTWQQLLHTGPVLMRAMDAIVFKFAP